MGEREMLSRNSISAVIWQNISTRFKTAACAFKSLGYMRAKKHA